jgi:hypothetical protein
MKKILIGLLALASLSTFAADKLARCTGDKLVMTIDQKGLVLLTYKGHLTVHTAIIGHDDEGYPHITNYELKLDKVRISDEDRTYVYVNNLTMACRADF